MPIPLLLEDEAAPGGAQYIPIMSQLLTLTRRFGFDAFIVLAAIVGVLDVVLRSEAARAPRTTLWLVAPAIALVVVPLLARRRFPFAAPASLWLLAAAASTGPPVPRPHVPARPASHVSFTTSSPTPSA